MSEHTVAVLGLGIIGSIWAGHYQAEGQLAAVWNRSPKPELPFEPVSLQACTEQADVLHICVYDADSVCGVLEQLIPFLGEQHTVIQSSTIDGASATKFAAMVAATGARYLEAPFTGSKPAAEQRKTVFFLGGDAAVVREHQWAGLADRWGRARDPQALLAQKCARDGQAEQLEEHRFP